MKPADSYADIQKVLNLLDCFPEKGELFWKRSVAGPRAHVAGKLAGCVNIRSGRRMIRMGGRLYFTHRLIWSYVNGPIPDGMLIDHINGDPADNRISNLRLATKSQNQFNLKPRQGGASRYRGVFKTTSRCLKPWRAVISKNKKKYHLGTFETEEEAAQAHFLASQKLYESFATPIT